MPERRLRAMTYPEIHTEIAAGVRTVIVPCGAIEQHGPHLPLSVDADHAGALAVQVAARLDALVAPTLEIGCSEHHMAFAGSLTISPETLEALFLDCCRSLAQHGFERILIFSAHMGNFEPLAAMAPRLNASVSPGAEVVVFADRSRFLRTWTEVVEQHCGRGDAVGGHADIAETSVLLALDPTSVRTDAAAPGHVGAPDPAMLAAVFREGVHALSENGVLGDPAGASAELGWLCMDAVTEVLVGYFSSAANGNAGA